MIRLFRGAALAASLLAAAPAWATDPQHTAPGADAPALPALVGSSDGAGHMVPTSTANPLPTQLQPGSSPIGSVSQDGTWSAIVGNDDGTGHVAPTSAANPLPVTVPGGNGTDYSANAPSLSALTLLATIPIPTAGRVRTGYLVAVPSTVAYDATLDDGTDTGTNCTPGKCTVVPMGSGAIVTLDMSGMPFTGRIRVFGPSGAWASAWAAQ